MIRKKLRKTINDRIPNLDKEFAYTGTVWTIAKHKRHVATKAAA